MAKDVLFHLKTPATPYEVRTYHSLNNAQKPKDARIIRQSTPQPYVSGLDAVIVAQYSDDGIAFAKEASRMVSGDAQVIFYTSDGGSSRKSPDGHHIVQLPESSYSIGNSPLVERVRTLCDWV